MFAEVDFIVVFTFYIFLPEGNTVYSLAQRCISRRRSVLLPTCRRQNAFFSEAGKRNVLADQLLLCAVKRQDSENLGTPAEHLEVPWGDEQETL